MLQCLIVIVGDDRFGGNYIYRSIAWMLGLMKIFSDGHCHVNSTVSISGMKDLHGFTHYHD